MRTINSSLMESMSSNTPISPPYHTPDTGPMDQHLYELDRKGQHLVLAAGTGEIETVKLLLADGADINTRSPPPCGKFNDGHDEVQGSPEMGWLLISSSLEGLVKVEMRNCERTALQAASDGGFKEIVDLLIEKGADVNAPPASVFGRTALQAASGIGSIEIVETLVLEAGANINAPPAEQYGRTALQAAAEGGHLEVVRFLIKHRAKIDSVAGEKFGRTALQAAAGAGWYNIVKFLLDEEQYLLSIDNDDAGEIGGKTALQAAAAGGYENVVGLLISKGADVNASPAVNYGTTALEAAARGGNEKILNLLFEAKVDISNPIGTPCTILHDAVDDENRLGMLLRLGKFNVNEKDHLGSTPLHIAIKKLKVASARLLINTEDADPNIADISGATPLLTALEKGSEELLSLLLQNGAGTDQLRVDQYVELVKGSDAIKQYHHERAIILREVLPQRRTVAAALWASTDIKNLKDENWCSPSICLFHSDDGHEFYNGGSRSDPQVYLKSYYDTKASQISQQTSPVVSWSWLTVHNRNIDSNHSTLFVEGIPNSQAMLSKSDTEVILVAYISFGVPAQSKYVPNGDVSEEILEMQSFKVITRNIDISWMMRELEGATESFREPRFRSVTYAEKFRGSFMRSATIESNFKGPPPRSATWNSTKGTFDRSTGSCLRSVNFRGTLRVKYLKIPRNGVEFFILFLDYVSLNWQELIIAAKQHLTKIRDAQLEKGGTEPRITECLLEDSQRWNEFRVELNKQVLKAQEVLSAFKKHEALYTELVDPEDWRENLVELPLIKELKKRIFDFESNLESKIKELADETNIMIDLEFSLVSIAEARRSIEMSMSMKRLSWITFIFLPLTFCSGLFGMNVNVLESNPGWWWYPVFAVPILGSVLVVWLLFKYIPVGAWVEQRIGSWIERNIGAPIEAKLLGSTKKAPPSPCRHDEGINPWGLGITNSMGPPTPSHSASRWQQAYRSRERNHTQVLRRHTNSNQANKDHIVEVRPS